MIPPLHTLFPFFEEPELSSLVDNYGVPANADKVPKKLQTIQTPFLAAVIQRTFTTLF